MLQTSFVQVCTIPRIESTYIFHLCAIFPVRYREIADTSFLWAPGLFFRFMPVRNMSQSQKRQLLTRLTGISCVATLKVFLKHWTRWPSTLSCARRTFPKGVAALDVSSQHWRDKANAMYCAERTFKRRCCLGCFFPALKRQSKCYVLCWTDIQMVSPPFSIPRSMHYGSTLCKEVFLQYGLHMSSIALRKIVHADNLTWTAPWGALYSFGLQHSKKKPSSVYGHACLRKDRQQYIILILFVRLRQERWGWVVLLLPKQSRVQEVRINGYQDSWYEG